MVLPDVFSVILTVFTTSNEKALTCAIVALFVISQCVCGFWDALRKPASTLSIWLAYRLSVSAFMFNIDPFNCSRTRGEMWTDRNLWQCPSSTNAITESFLSSVKSNMAAAREVWSLYRWTERRLFEKFGLSNRHWDNWLMSTHTKRIVVLCDVTPCSLVEMYGVVGTNVGELTEYLWSRRLACWRKVTDVSEEISSSVFRVQRASGLLIYDSEVKVPRSFETSGIRAQRHVVTSRSLESLSV